jgi:hypothetical protein
MIWPAIVRLPVRDVVEVFGATVRLTLLVPVPVAPVLIVIHVAPLVAVQAQPSPAVTVTLEVPPAAPIERVDGDTVGEAHGALYAKVFDRSLIATPPGPLAPTRASYITPEESGFSSATKSTRISPSGPGSGLPRVTCCIALVPPARKTWRTYFPTIGVPSAAIA